MAVFNPQVPEQQEPNYIGYSKGVSVPSALRPEGQQIASIQPKGVQFEVQPYKGPVYEGNKHVDMSGYYSGVERGYEAQAQGEREKAAGYAQQGALAQQAAGIKTAALGEEATASLISGSLGLANMAAKEADFLIKDSVSKSIYQEVDREREAQVAKLEALSGQATNLLKNTTLDEEGNPVIARDLKDLPKVAENLKQAQLAGNFGMTHYKGVLYSLLKEYRERLPAYREYIDQTMHQASGMDVANSYMQAKVADLRAAASASVKEPKELQFTKAHMSTGGIWDAYREFQRTGNADQFYSKANELIAFDYKFRQRDTERKMSDLDTADRQKRAEDDFGEYSAQMIRNSLRDAEAVIPNLQQRIENNTFTPDQKEADQYMQLLQIKKQQATQQLMDYLTNPQSDSGPRRPPIMDLSDTKVKTAIREAEEPFNFYTDLVQNKEYGSAHWLTRYLDGVSKEDVAKMLEDPVAGQALRMMQVLKKTAPETLGTAAGEHLITTINSRFKTLSQQGFLKSLTQPDRADGKIFTIQDELDKAYKLDANDPAYNREMINRIDMLTNPGWADPRNDARKRDLLDYYFNPNAARAYNLYGQDGRDQNGKWRSGKVAVYEKFTNEANSDEIARIAKAYPEAAQYHLNYALQQFDSIFSSEIKTLNETGQSIPFEWNSTDHQIKSPTQNPVVQDSIYNLNRGIRGMANVLKAQGMEPNKVDALILNKLNSLGYRAGQPAVNPLTGLNSAAQSLLDAITNAAKGIYNNPLEYSIREGK